MAVSDKNTNLIWMDLEMTGLDLDQHRIIQTALVITNSNLEVLFPGVEIAVHQPDEKIEKANDWVKENLRDHLEDSRKSEFGEKEAESNLLSIIKEYTTEKTSPLCGNSIWLDRAFVLKYMPNLENYLLHRNIDVSSIKELYRRWRPGKPFYKKSETHKALEDIRESIEELKFYVDQGFIVV